MDAQSVEHVEWLAEERARLIMENERLRKAVEDWHDAAVMAERHLESLQNRYAQATAKIEVYRAELQRLGDGEIDDLSIAHDALSEIVQLRLHVAELSDHLESLQNKYAQVSADNDTMQTAIDDFCTKSEWGAGTWKMQPHIAALFRLRSAPNDQHKQRRSLASA